MWWDKVGSDWEKPYLERFLLSVCGAFLTVNLFFWVTQMGFTGQSEQITLSGLSTKNWHDISGLVLKNVVYPDVMGSLETNPQQVWNRYFLKVTRLFKHSELGSTLLVRGAVPVWEGNDCQA